MFRFRLLCILSFIWISAYVVISSELSPWLGIASVCVGFLALFSALFAQVRS